MSRPKEEESAQGTEQSKPESPDEALAELARQLLEQQEATLRVAKGARALSILSGGLLSAHPLTVINSRLFLPYLCKAHEVEEGDLELRYAAIVPPQPGSNPMEESVYAQMMERLLGENRVLPAVTPGRVGDLEPDSPVHDSLNGSLRGLRIALQELERTLAQRAAQAADEVKEQG